MSAQLDSHSYFDAMEATIRQDATNPWIEAFCQRAMMMRAYSVRNVALILSQFPEATYVAGRSQFKEEGIAVLPGATPIYITAPRANHAEAQAGGFSWATVYDVSQTSARPSRHRKKGAAEYLQRVVRLTKQAGINVVSANLTNGAWKVLEGTTLYLKKGVAPELAFQLICHELAYWALVKEGAAARLAFSLAAIVSYSVGVGLGLPMPNLSPQHKLVACEGAKLLSNMDRSIKVAKRLLSAVKKA